MDRDVAELETLGYGLRRLDLESADAESFHDLIAASLNLPDYYGRNLHALSDCASELPYTFGSDLLLVFDSFDAFFRRDQEFAHAVLDVLCRDAFRNQLVGHTTLVLVLSSDPRIQLPRVGSSAIYWNPAEFLDKNRGL